MERDENFFVLFRSNPNLDLNETSDEWAKDHG